MPTMRIFRAALILGLGTLGTAGCSLTDPGDLVTFTPPPACEAIDGEGFGYPLTPTQASNAATITAVSLGRGMPEQAAKIAVATAMQESSLRNLNYGDRDSLGLFQQRPSQGWGSPEEVQDPIYASNAFYSALDKVPDYQLLELTVAAQTVQRSAFPDAYANHESMATAWASALTGVGSMSCTFSTSPPGLGATEIAALASRDFGPELTATVTASPTQSSDSPASGSAGQAANPDETLAPAAPTDATESITFDSGSLANAWGRDGAVVNDAVAKWSVAQAYGLGIESVTTANGQQWTPAGDWVDVSGMPTAVFTPDAVTITVASPQA